MHAEHVSFKNTTPTHAPFHPGIIHRALAKFHVIVVVFALGINIVTSKWRR